MEDRFDFEAYLEAGAGKLTGYCAAVVGPTEAEDAAQEAYLRLWRNLRSLPKRPRSLCRRRLQSWKKRSRKRPSLRHSTIMTRHLPGFRRSRIMSSMRD